MKRALDGVGVLITRPIEQAGGLAQAVESAGGRALLYPTMRIVPIQAGEIDAQLRAAADAVDLVFASPTAVRIGVPLLGLPCAGPVGRRYFAVGEGTARELKKFALQPIISPALGADSEALLALPQMQHLSGRTMAIIRGEGGRELLCQTVRARGAEVTLVECYRRELPVEGFPVHAEQEVQAVTATSGDIVSNLFYLAGPKRTKWLREVPLFVAHPRVSHRAFQCGARTVCVARVDSGVGTDIALADALCRWFDH